MCDITHLGLVIVAVPTFFLSILRKGVYPPENLTKRGTEFLADGEVDVFRQIDSKSKSTTVVELPGLLPTMQSFVFSSSA